MSRGHKYEITVVSFNGAVLSSATEFSLEEAESDLQAWKHCSKITKYTSLRSVFKTNIYMFGYQFIKIAGTTHGL